MMRDQYRETQRNRNSYGDGADRGWWDRTSDEVSSWFGDEGAERRRGQDERRSTYGGDGMRGRNYGARYGGPGRSRGERAADVMTRDVVRVHPQDTIQHAAKLMEGYDCGSLPVVDRSNRLIGMITDRDITVRGIARHWDAGRMPVGAVMTDEAFACHVDDTVQNCMQAMAEHQVRRIPVVDDRDRVVGIISQADLARHVGDRNTGIGGRAVAEVVREVSEPSSNSYRN